MQRIVILTEGSTNPTDAKTASGLIRYRRDEVVALLDSTAAGKTAQELLGVGGDIPCIASLEEAEADALLIGIAPAGGRLPESWRRIIRDAVGRGLDVVNGLHEFIGDDEEFRNLAAAHGVALRDVRKPPRGLTVSRNLARKTPCFRVHTVGHDCSVGKMLVAIELTRALEARGRRAAFLATGQTGILIAGSGIPVDAVVSDFVAGAIESQVLEAQDNEFLLIEGQGSLVHPMYSGVTLSLLHGCAPQAMVMCVDPSRTDIRHCDMAMPPLEKVIQAYELLARIVAPSEVVAIALNTAGLPPARAEEEVDRIQERIGLPATDVIRFGPEPIVEAILTAEAEVSRRRALRSGRGR